MLKHYLLSTALLLAGLNLLAQCPRFPFVELKTQADVDQFLIDYPDCTNLPSGLSIGFDRSWDKETEIDITNLKGLANLRTIQGNLLIENTKLKTLDDLNLTDTIISGILSISSNALLHDIDALSNIVEVKGQLSLGGNPALENLNGLSKLKKVGRSFFISAMNKLVDLSGLSNLQSVGALFIDYNDNLKSLDGLEALDSSVSSLWIIENSQLESIVGISNIKLDSILSLNITRNTILKDCSAKNICQYLTESGNADVEFFYNSTGCNSKEEILQACAESPLPTPAHLYALPAPPPLKSQAELNAFVAQFPADHSAVLIEGDLIIEPPKGATIHDITDLSGLAKISAINGKLEIARNSQLTSLSGLDKLTRVSGHLKIYNNHTLINLTALGALTSIGGDLELSHNILLTNLDGLNNLDSIGGALRIVRNSKLSNLDALQSITKLNGKLNIRDNGALTNIDGLSSITGRQSGHVSIMDNDALLNINGLRGITEIIGGLTISHNINLPNLDALAGLESIQGPLEILYNDELTSIDGLSQTEIMTRLKITGNPKLETCKLQKAGLVCHAQSKNEVEISDNADGCSSKSDICKDQ